MKVLDPQSGLLTIAEVHHFLSTNPARPPDKRVGAYESVKLKEYLQVRQDLDDYTRCTIPYVRSYPTPETYMRELAARLRKFGLTKTEAMTLINLGVGLDRPKSATNEEILDLREDGTMVGTTESAPAQDLSDINHRQQLSLVVEELDERFPGDEGVESINQILSTLKEYLQGSQKVNGANGTHGHDIQTQFNAPA